MTEGPDRRERNKQRTRLAIQNAAFELFAEHGYRDTTINAIREWMASTMTDLDSGESSGRVWERRALRAHIINAEPELRGRARAGYHEFERVLADAIGEDLNQPGTALTPRLAALTAVTGLRELYETDEAISLPSPPHAAELLALVDRVIAFTQAG